MTAGWLAAASAVVERIGESHWPFFRLRSRNSWRKSPLMWSRYARFFNATVAIVTALAWFAGTHHCLLGLMTQPQSTAVSACHCSEPSKGSNACNDVPSRMLACCQGLLSPNSELAHAKVKFSPVLVGFQLFAVACLVPFRVPQSSVLSTEYDTGPPVWNAFVAIVLKRSLCENAPPRIA